MAGGVRPLPADPAVPDAEPRHEPRPIPVDLLVGVVAPAPGAADRGGVLRALRLVPGAARDRPADGLAARHPVRARRAAGAGRLVDGGGRAGGPALCGARAADDPPGPRLRALGRPGLDGARRLGRLGPPDPAEPLGRAGAVAGGSR